MCVPRRGLGLGVSKQLSYNMKTDALAHEIARIGVAQIVQSEFFEACTSAERSPELLDIREGLIWRVSWEEIWVLWVSLTQHC